MAEQYRVRDTQARTYIGVIVLFFLVGAAAWMYWSTRPPREVRDARDAEQEQAPAVVGTAGESRPGGHNPIPRPDDAREEIEFRGGSIMTDLNEVVAEGGRNTVGRRVDIDDATVERVDSPTAFWISSDEARIPVVAPAMAESLTRGQKVRVVGTVEEYGIEMRIRASRVEVAK